MKNTLLLLLLVLLLPAQAEGVLSGKQVAKNVKEIHQSIPWKNLPLSELQLEAQRTKKMVFFLQIVGELYDGL
jgi:hypothetical protein